ncbi:MAG: hypothetical protein LC789_03565 [Actinobacteria bacterium]|nr:hypothetical protein [Actinomycetota bacterium]MCA1722415.1 hypothetical protein [Actinomycetota bacterium]
MRVRRFIPYAGYAAVATVSQLRALPHYASRTQPDGDIPQTDWFLAWTSHVVRSGVNPWITEVVNAPQGVNLTWNTTLPLPGLLAAPVTALAGPVAAHNLLLWVAIFGSMLAMRWCAGAVTRRSGTAWLAGLAYGCSPYLISQGLAHLNLALVIVPPLLTRVLFELYSGRTGWVRSGLRLGILAVAQFLITEEVLASFVVTAAAATAVLAVRHRGDVDRGHVQRASKALALGAGMALLLLAVPLYVQLFGRLALHGAAATPVSFSADVLGLLVPNRTALLHNTWADGWSGNPSENGSFVGPVVLGLVLWVAYRYRGAVRDWALVALVAWVLSLGGFVRIGGHSTPIKLPFLAVWKLPLLANLAPARFSLYVVIGVVLSLATASDHWSLPRTGRARAGCAALAVGAVVPLLPAWPYPYIPNRTPAYFTTGSYKELPHDAVIQTWPVARHRYGSPTSSPVEWQAVADFWYRTTAGHVITRAPDGRGTQDGGMTAWELAARSAVAGEAVGAAQVAAVRDEWRRLAVVAVLVDPSATGAPEVRALLHDLTGRDADATRLGIARWETR